MTSSRFTQIHILTFDGGNMLSGQRKGSFKLRKKTAGQSRQCRIRILVMWCNKTVLTLIIGKVIISIDVRTAESFHIFCCMLKIHLFYYQK